MVRPVPPHQEVTGASGTSGNESSPNANDPAAGEETPQSGYSQADAALRRRLGSGFEPRGSTMAAEQDEGAALYRGFLNDEFRRRNLPEPSELFSRDSTYHRTPEASSADVMEAACQLRSLADEFSRSPMRLWVEERAATVSLQDLDFNAFSDLLYGLFQEGGVTWERVVVLFYFCSDLAVRAFREQLPRQLHNIVEWSFRFFAGERMLTWITSNGGWVRVMQKSVSQAYKLAKLTLLVLGVFTFATFLWRSR